MAGKKKKKYRKALTQRKGGTAHCLSKEMVTRSSATPMTNQKKGLQSEKFAGTRMPSDAKGEGKGEAKLVTVLHLPQRGGCERGCLTVLLSS